MGVYNTKICGKYFLQFKFSDFLMIADQIHIKQLSLTMKMLRYDIFGSPGMVAAGAVPVTACR